ncbi:unnamed protein product [Angiostrongylus costaricensis]|uniref:GRIP domain-containing protein n=1 Tax=Angiostrongylus costaricensis TaxID=334426 RepID=A0A0R3PJE6_ANGCS|nr:unnamed protein product [Angiostrongylus costaricensis]
MSFTPSKHDLAAFFGSSESRTSKVSSVNVDVSHGTKGLLRDSYVKSNQSLIMKIHQLEAKIRNSNRTIDALREENALLKKKLCDRENMDDSHLVDALIEERVKRKLHKLRIISTRTIAYLQKAALNLKEAVEDFGCQVLTEKIYFVRFTVYMKPSDEFVPSATENFARGSERTRIVF